MIDAEQEGTMRERRETGALGGWKRKMKLVRELVIRSGEYKVNMTQI